MKKLVLSALLALCLALPLPAFAVEEGTAQTYEEAVALIRDTGHYAVETFLDTDLCSIFLYRAIGTPHSAYHYLTVVYKAGSPLGEGAQIVLPLRPDIELWGTTLAPTLMGLSEDESYLRYSYHTPGLGEDIYSVHLSTGEVTMAHVPPSHEELVDSRTWGYTVEQQLEAPPCTVLLMWSDLMDLPETDQVRDYVLELVFWEEIPGKPQTQRLLLPSTAAVEGEYASQYPTHRAPDRLSLNEDGSVLTYVYAFDEPLFNANGDLLHDSGAYTYRVDTATGELSVTHAPLPEAVSFSDVPPDSWFAQGVATCAREGIMVGTGEDTFSQEATLTYPECVMLAYRLYDKAHGGDGSLLKAPEDWSYMTIDTDDGQLHHEGFAGDSNVWGYTSLTGGEERYIFVRPKDMEMLNQFHNYHGFGDCGATVTLEGQTYHGTVVMTRQIAYQTYYFTFRPDDPQVTDILIDAQEIPAGDKWWRDLAYTVRQRGWEELFSLYPQSHTAIRHTFANQLDAVVDLPQRFEVETIPDLSREYAPEVFRLYEAGILGGTDDYGTFSGGGELTRAEAAVMVARVLEEGQRLKEPPKPMPVVGPESYTLTYLAEGHILHFISSTTFPLCPIYRSTEEDPYEPLGLLTLEGELLPWTAEGMELSSLERQGPYLMAYFRREEPNYQYTTGVLDETGRWIVPPGEFESVWPRAEGFGASSGSNEDYRAFLLDSQGQVLSQTDREDPALAAVDLPVPEPWGGLTAPNSWVSGQRYYQRPDGSPASGWFDDCGQLGPDGRGFVEKDGKIYRIQFGIREEE
ncbi:MAG: S-layer homology domain-containing protein [Oscillospiraceae bacterium]|nr:S-layer homology domain-containing protein [Oscillospiraceae bacterium]